MAEDINQLLKVRREKLQNLQEAGKDPFKITKCDVTHHSMEIKNNYDELKKLSGFRMYLHPEQTAFVVSASNP